jgi:hypothetical protein
MGEDPKAHRLVDPIPLFRRKFSEPLRNEGSVVRDERIFAALDVFETRKARTGYF